MHHFIDIVTSNDQSLQNVGTLLGLAQIILRTADRYIMTMLYKIFHTISETQQTWATLHQCDAVHRERTLQSRHFEQFIENNVGIGIFLHVNHDAHSLATGLIIDIRNAVEFTLLDQIGNILDQHTFVDSIRNLRNNDLVVALTGLNLHLGTHDDTATSGLVGFLNTLESINISPCREIRSRNVTHQFTARDRRIVDIGATTVDDLAQIVRRNIGSHTHGNTISAINKKVGNFRRHHGRLLKGIIEVVDHINGLLLKIVHRTFANLGEAAFRITHSSGRIAVDRTEVTLAVNKFVAHVPILSHTHQRAVDRAVAMRVILTQNLTHDAGTFLIRLVAGIADTHHTIEDSTMNRLESISDIGKGSCHNHGHRIIYVGRFHLFLNVDLQNSVLINCLIIIHYLILLFFSQIAPKAVFSPSKRFRCCFDV